MKFHWDILLTVIVALIVYKLINHFLGLETMIDNIGK